MAPPKKPRKFKIGRWLVLGLALFLLGKCTPVVPWLSQTTQSVWQNLTAPSPKKEETKESEKEPSKSSKSEVSDKAEKPRDPEQPQNQGWLHQALASEDGIEDLKWQKAESKGQTRWVALVPSSAALGADRQLSFAHPHFLDDLRGELESNCAKQWPVQLKLTEKAGVVASWSYVCGEVSASYERHVRAANEVFWTNAEGCLRGAPCWRWPLPQWVSWDKFDSVLIFKSHVESEVRTPIDAVVMSVQPSAEGFAVKMRHGMVWEIELRGIQQYGELPKVGQNLKMGSRLGLIRTGLPVQWRIWRQGQVVIPSEAYLWSWPQRKLRS
jgi:hypothetical protein